jgi:hypothetical protein
MSAVYSKPRVEILQAMKLASELTECLGCNNTLCDLCLAGLGTVAGCVFRTRKLRRYSSVYPKGLAKSGGRRFRGT